MKFFLSYVSVFLFYLQRINIDWLYYLWFFSSLYKSLYYQNIITIVNRYGKPLLIIVILKLDIPDGDITVSDLFSYAIPDQSLSTYDPESRIRLKHPDTIPWRPTLMALLDLRKELYFHFLRRTRNMNRAPNTMYPTLLQNKQYECFMILTTLVCIFFHIRYQITYVRF